MSYYNSFEYKFQEEEFLPSYIQPQYSYESQFMEIQPTFQGDGYGSVAGYEYYPEMRASRSYDHQLYDTEMGHYPNMELQLTYPNIYPDNWPCQEAELNSSVEATEVNENSRRNLFELLKSDYKFKDSKYLIFFTFSLLNDPSNQDVVWKDESAGRFYIKNPQNFAQSWGRFKGKRKMNYNKVARSLRYYYKDGLLSKSEGLREYVWDPLVLSSLRQRFRSGRGTMGGEFVSRNST